MSFNYRIVHEFGSYPEKMIKKNPELQGKVHHSFSIHTVYYNDDGIPDSLSKEPVSPGGTNYIEFIRDWDQYESGFRKEVLHFSLDENKFVDHYKEHK